MVIRVQSEAPAPAPEEYLAAGVGEEKPGGARSSMFVFCLGFRGPRSRKCVFCLGFRARAFAFEYRTPYTPLYLKRGL